MEGERKVKGKRNEGGKKEKAFPLSLGDGIFILHFVKQFITFFEHTHFHKTVYFKALNIH